LKCRFCGNQIAEKALICYRCGKATTDPVVTPPPTGSLFAKRRRSKMPFMIAAIVLIVLALLVWFVLGMGARSGKVPRAGSGHFGHVSRTRVAREARPIIEGWLFASYSSASQPRQSCSSPCRIARWQPAWAAMSPHSVPRSLAEDRQSV
jgi:hypothetical protein